MFVVAITTSGVHTHYTTSLRGLTVRPADCEPMQALSQGTAWQGMPEGVAPGLLRGPGLCHGRAVGIKKTGLDVGTVRGLFLIRIGDLFVCPDYSALSNTLIRCQVAERAVWAALLIVEPPGFASMIFQEF